MDEKAPDQISPPPGDENWCHFALAFLRAIMKPKFVANVFRCMAPVEILRRRCRAFLAAFYLSAGIAHLIFPAPLLIITPGWVPHADLVILVTGLCELAGAAALWLPPLRRYAAIGLALYAVCVFPANIKHALDSLGGPSSTFLQWTYHVVRLPLQPLIVWIALFAGEVTSWPLARTDRS